MNTAKLISCKSLYKSITPSPSKGHPHQGPPWLAAPSCTKHLPVQSQDASLACHTLDFLKIPHLVAIKDQHFLSSPSQQKNMITSLSLLPLVLNT